MFLQEPRELEYYCVLSAATVSVSRCVLSADLLLIANSRRLLRRCVVEGDFNVEFHAPRSPVVRELKKEISLSKPTIFLSHITEEKELAALFKQQIETSFLGLINVFVSSDAASIPLGKNWLDQVTEGLRSCKAMFLLCSPASISRPWLNFEAGAAWARNIEVAPICHSGLRPVDLPLPVSLLQGVEANDPNRLDQIFAMIARQIGSAAPKIDATGMVDKVKAFESVYAARIRYLVDAQLLKSLNAGLVTTLLLTSPEQTIALNNFAERDYTLIRPSLLKLEEAGGLQQSFGLTGMTLGGVNSGAYGTLTLRATKELHDLLKQL